MEPTRKMTAALEQLKDLFRLQPETRLFAVDAERICGLEANLCHTILAALEDVRFVRREHDGAYRAALTECLE